MPLADLCYKNGNGCWVGGQVGDTCPYIDPKGNGGEGRGRCVMHALPMRRVVATATFH